jgi:hypothetical protein
MTPLPRPVRIHHCTSEPYRFFGRAAELQLLDRALAGEEPSVVALVGPGGQGKTAIVQHWLEALVGRADRPAGVFLWSFYRGKDADLCLREMYAYAVGLDRLPDVAASYAVDRLIGLLARERWAVVLDGTEVAQYDAGPWRGRFVHPELGRLVEELASISLPGVVVLTSRFELPTLATRRHARIVSLSALDAASARGLLTSLGVCGTDVELDEVAAAGGYHAKAVELLGTFLRRYHQGEARRHAELACPLRAEGASEEEYRVACVLTAYQKALPGELQDVIAQATAFRDPPTEARLLDYLASPPVHTLLHSTWKRTYLPFGDRPAAQLGSMVQELVDLRLLERVGRGGPITPAERVIDAHPLVRRAFEHVIGAAGQRQTATARAGFLGGRPDRRRPETLEEATEEIELFHAYCDAGLWNEADSAFVALDNPKHRFLAPALERDLLLRFFPGGDWRQLALWPGFGRFRSLAICCEMLGHFEEALAIYREPDAPLRGDGLIALGRLEPLLRQPQAPHAWQTLWQAYRAHALCLAGRTEEAVAAARAVVPVDVYEWVHIFECLLRAGQLGAIDLRSILFRSPNAAEHRWADLARRRMRADYVRVLNPGTAELGSEFQRLLEAYDQGGLPYERCLTRLSYASWLIGSGELGQAESVNGVTLTIATQYHMSVIRADALATVSVLARRNGEQARADRASQEAQGIRKDVGYAGPARP